MALEGCQPRQLSASTGIYLAQVLQRKATVVPIDAGKRGELLALFPSRLVGLSARTNDASGRFPQWKVFFSARRTRHQFAQFGHIWNKKNKANRNTKFDEPLRAKSSDLGLCGNPETTLA